MSQAFDKVDQHLVGYYGTVRDHISREVTRQNLLPYLEQPPLEIADVGGGEGRDSEWLVDQGYEVTLVDPSFEQIRLAATRDKRIHLMRGDDQTLLKEKGDQSFDVVLSHGVIMYELKDPEAHLDRLVRLLRPGGLLSLLTEGYHGVEERLLSQHDDEALADLHRTHQFNQPKEESANRVWAFDEHELTRMIEETGARVLNWAGVGIVTDEDDRQLTDVRPRELNSILAREIALAHDPAHRAAGHMLHFIAQK